MKYESIGVLDGRRFLGDSDFVIWDCHTEGRGIFDGRLHFHDFYELSFVYEGEGSYAVNGRSFPVTGGFLLLTTPSDHHMLTVKDGSVLHYYNVIFRANLLPREVTDSLYALSVPLCFTATGADYDSFFNDFKRMLADYSEEPVDPIPPLSAILIHSAIRAVTVRLIKALAKSSPVSAPPKEDAVRRALLFIRENFRTKITLARVAEAVELSPGYFSSCFSRVMGIGFAEYLLRYRLIAAADYIISTDMPLKAVASICGFSSLPYFSAAFSEYFGTSPRNWRKRAPKGS